MNVGMPTKEEHDRDVPVITCPGCGWERQLVTYEQYRKLRSLLSMEEIISGHINQTAEEYMDSIHADNDGAIATHVKICADYRREQRELAAVLAKAKEVSENVRPGGTVLVNMVSDGQGGVRIVDQRTIEEGRLDS